MYINIHMHTYATCNYEIFIHFVVVCICQTNILAELSEHRIYEIFPVYRVGFEDLVIEG